MTAGRFCSMGSKAAHPVSVKLMFIAGAQRFSFCAPSAPLLPSHQLFPVLCSQLPIHLSLFSSFPRVIQPLELAGYISAAAIGLSLGLIGGGGSILTVPVLVYLFGVDPLPATTYSLFIVGLTSLFGAGAHLRLGNVNWRVTAMFGVPSVISVTLMRGVVVPAIPATLLTVGDFTLTKSLALLLLFAVLMVTSATKMLQRQEHGHPLHTVTDGSHNYWGILLKGLMVGAITGLIGAGGGFLIIPALVLMAGLPMKQAVGTSLTIITLNASVGFASSIAKTSALDWNLLIALSSIAAVGILAGTTLSRRISNEKLKPAFGWFVLTVGAYIIVRELVLSGARP